jgi:hypothetical protein
MFIVEIQIPNEDGLADEMDAMRTWLDHRGFASATLETRGAKFPARPIDIFLNGTGFTGVDTDNNTNLTASATQ